ncbi:GGDEF domain-containing protein [Nanoarchaeota archaeon]
MTRKGDSDKRNMRDANTGLPDLESVMIKVSIGIGHNLTEAEEGLKVAKSRKDENRHYNIELYRGESLPPPMEERNPVVDSFIRLEQKLRCENLEDSISDLYMLKHDPKTGLLNRMGYEVEVQKLRQRHSYDNRVIILIDGDDMKRTNTRLGYELTDRYLEAIGHALKRQVRQASFTRDGMREADVLVNRKNDSGGDEFIIDIACDYRNAASIAERYVHAMYALQSELSRKLTSAGGTGYLEAAMNNP